MRSPRVLRAKHELDFVLISLAATGETWHKRCMTFTITIRDSRGTHKPFPFDAILPETAARDAAAEGDWEPWEKIELEVDDGRVVSVFEVYTHPPYEPRLVSVLPR